MTRLSFMECCHLFAIDPKTLRQWLTHAHMSLHSHPTDARIKCLTSEQVHVLANLHDRVLQTSELAPPCASPNPGEAESQKLLATVPDADLRARLERMEAQVATLQAQLTDLALQLLQERQQCTQQLLLVQQAQFPLTREQEFASSALSVPCPPAMPPLVCHPTEQRSRLIPLIEYGARGQYGVCPQ